MCRYCLDLIKEDNKNKIKTMPTNVSEMNLEDMILAYLRDEQGYEEGTTNDYMKDYALDTERVKRFLLSTQKKKVENTACFSNVI